MPRIARIVVTGYPHHITQRGNYKQRVFAGMRDYRFYLGRLNEYQKKYKLSILAYCLMPNHVHFIAVPRDKDSLAKTFNAAHMRYAHYYNKKSSQTGHLWQGRFYSCVMDENHLYAAVRYIENNPVRSKLVKKPWDWKWSSAREHIEKGKSSLKLADISEFMTVDDWKEYICERLNEKEIENIRKSTLTGRPLGDDAFIAKLEAQFGRRLKALPRGRPWEKGRKAIKGK